MTDTEIYIDCSKELEQDKAQERDTRSHRDIETETHRGREKQRDKRSGRHEVERQKDREYVRAEG